MKDSLRLPDKAKTLIVLSQLGEFRGQATYWNRNNRWSMIGVTKSANWLHDVSFIDVKTELAKRGLKFKWVNAMPFTTRKFAKEGVNYGWV